MTCATPYVSPAAAHAAAHAAEQQYAVDVALFGRVAASKSTHSVHEFYIDVIMPKAQAGRSWEYLSSSPKSNKIKVDWDRWVDEDDESSQTRASPDSVSSMQRARAVEEAKSDLRRIEKERDALIAAGKKKKSGRLVETYLLVYNTIQCLGWYFVAGSLLLSMATAFANDGYVGSEYFATIYSQLGPHVVFLQALATLELVNAILRLVPGNPLSSLLLHAGRNVCLVICAYFPEAAADWGVWAVFLAW